MSNDYLVRRAAKNTATNIKHVSWPLNDTVYKFYVIVKAKTNLDFNQVFDFYTWSLVIHQEC